MKRWDFETEEEYSSYQSGREAMPKLASHPVPHSPFSHSPVLHPPILHSPFSLQGRIPVRGEDERWQEDKEIWWTQ